MYVIIATIAFVLFNIPFILIISKKTSNNLHKGKITELEDDRTRLEKDIGSLRRSVQELCPHENLTTGCNWPLYRWKKCDVCGLAEYITEEEYIELKKELEAKNIEKDQAELDARKKKFSDSNEGE